MTCPLCNATHNEQQRNHRSAATGHLFCIDGPHLDCPNTRLDPAKPPWAWAQVLSGPAAGLWWALTEERVTFGRKLGSMWVGDTDDHVHNLHCFIMRMDGELWIVETSSPHGVSIDGKRIEGKAQIDFDQVLQLGNIEMVLRRPAAG